MKKPRHFEEQEPRDGKELLPEPLELEEGGIERLRQQHEDGRRDAVSQQALPAGDPLAMERTDRDIAGERQHGVSANRRNRMMETSVKSRKSAALHTPSGLSHEAVHDISAAANTLLADVFALYLKTKNFHWHMSGPQFRDYHLLLDEQSDQIIAMTDPLAERVRKLGAATIRSVGDISRRQRIQDNDADFVHPHEMLAELREDNATLVERMRTLHDLCDEHGDVATASLIENWIDESERRVWFLFETLRLTN